MVSSFSMRTDGCEKNGSSPNDRVSKLPGLQSFACSSNMFPLQLKVYWFKWFKMDTFHPLWQRFLDKPELSPQKISACPGSIGDFYGLGKGNFAASTGQEAIAAFSNGPWATIYRFTIDFLWAIVPLFFWGLSTNHDGKPLLHQP